MSLVFSGKLVKVLVQPSPEITSILRVVRKHYLGHRRRGCCGGFREEIWFDFEHYFTDLIFLIRTPDHFSRANLRKDSKE